MPDSKFAAVAFVIALVGMIAIVCLLFARVTPERVPYEAWCFHPNGELLYNEVTAVAPEISADGLSVSVLDAQTQRRLTFFNVPCMFEPIDLTETASATFSAVGDYP